MHHANVNVNLTVKSVTQIKFESNNKCQCDYKNLRRNVCEKGYIWNLATCNCENVKYLESIINNSVICQEIIEMTRSTLTKTVQTKSILANLNEKKVIWKTTFFFYFTCLFINYHNVINSC